MEENEVYLTESNEERLLLMAYLSSNGYKFSKDVWKGVAYDWGSYPTIMYENDRRLTLGPRHLHNVRRVSKEELYKRLDFKQERRLTPHNLI